MNIVEDRLTVNEETGEVTLSPEDQRLLDELGNLPCHPGNVDYRALEETCTAIADRLAKNMEQAARYRNQAELMCKRLDANAKFWQQQLAEPLKKLAEHKLPRVKSGERAGQFSSKTLHLPSLSFSFSREGGKYISNKIQALKFYREHVKDNPSLETTIRVDVNTSAFLEWLKCQTKIRDQMAEARGYETEAHALDALIAKANTFIVDLPANELATFTPKLPNAKR